MLLCCLGYPQMPELQWAIGASQVIGTTGEGQPTGFSFSATALHNSRDLTWAWGSQGIKKWQRWCNVIQMNREVGFMVYSQQRRRGLWYTAEQRRVWLLYRKISVREQCSRHNHPEKCSRGHFCPHYQHPHRNLERFCHYWALLEG